MNDGLRATAHRARTKVSKSRVGTMFHRDSTATTRKIRNLRRRVDELEDEVQESRRLNRRVAELLDVVEELLLPVAQRDEEKIQEYVKRYSSSI
jgi:hypothetical protein